MPHHCEIIANENGSVLLFTLVILLLITIAGLGALNTTNTEINISGNDKCFRQNLVRAESAIFELTQVMRNDTTPETNLLPSSSALTWLHTTTDAFNPQTSVWNYATNASPSDHFSDNLSGYTAIYEGTAQGAALDMANKTTMRQYEIYGRSEQCNGWIDVVAGYRIRF